MNAPFPPHSLHRALALAAVLGLALACGRASLPPPLPPYETLLDIVTDYKRQSQTDLYRYETPRDASGQNLFRATLARLDAFQTAHPDSETDLVDWVRAEALARLGDFPGAAAAYGRVQTRTDSPLAPRAGEERRKMQLLARAVAPAEGGAAPANRLDALDARLTDLRSLAAEFPARFESGLLRREIEKTEMEKALVLMRNRLVLPQGDRRAVEQLQGLVRDHADSRLLQAHRLSLGRLYLELARDLADLAPPDRLDFDLPLCYNLLGAAQEQFRAAARADGYDEKLEAVALDQEADAFSRKIAKQAR